MSAADKPDTYTVSATATGGRLAWARAHQRAVTEASDYCEHQGLETSNVVERTNGLEALKQQDVVLQFECYPKL